MTREELRGEIIARLDGRNPPALYSERTADAILAIVGAEAVKVAMTFPTLEFRGGLEPTIHGEKIAAALRELFEVEKP